ncbi:hypothetical protein N7513_011643 [Penicillium frequentans]|nr:hypothetical protein N7513_011643 [Penicillium glabrum]
MSRICAVLWEPHIRLVSVSRLPRTCRVNETIVFVLEWLFKDDLLLIDSTIRTTDHTDMDIIASAEAAATLAGMFLEIVEVTKHVIETMRGA